MFEDVVNCVFRGKCSPLSYSDITVVTLVYASRLRWRVWASHRTVLDPCLWHSRKPSDRISSHLPRYLLLLIPQGIFLIHRSSRVPDRLCDSIIDVWA